jgi:hypothetical protein
MHRSKYSIKLMKTINIFLAVLLFIHHLSANAQASFSTCPKELNNSSFRDMIIGNIEIATGISSSESVINSKELGSCLNNHYQVSEWTMQLSCYQDGRVVARSREVAKDLDLVIAKSVNAIQEQVVDNKKCQFKCDFSYYPDRHYAFIDYKHHGLELAGNRVAVRKVSVDLIKKQIKDSIGYLRLVQHPKLNGFYKFYNAGKDQHEHLLRTIYTSSSLYTFMLAEKTFPELNLSKHFKSIAQFILSQQLREGPEKGAFYYSFNLKTQQPRKKLVVGTASKTIFTLLELNKYYPNEPKYLKSGIEAGNWLVHQVKDDGKVISYKKFKKSRWIASEKQSLLYSGQVLSALSRLYLVAPNLLYREKAEKIAKLFLSKIKESGPLLGDDYRPANLISTSWAMRSLMDFHQLQAASPQSNKGGSNNNDYLQAIQLLANKINQLQIKNLQDISYAGKFSDSMTTSGNGWLNEVFGDYYHFCRKNKLENCASFLNASILSTRYLLQNAYRQDNSYNISDPAFAKGAFILKYSNHMVRTDAVCHGVNSFLYLLRNLSDKDGVLLDIPEQSIQTLLPLIRAGNKNVT